MQPVDTGSDGRGTARERAAAKGHPRRVDRDRRCGPSVALNVCNCEGRPPGEVVIVFAIVFNVFDIEVLQRGGGGGGRLGRLLLGRLLWVRLRPSRCSRVGRDGQWRDQDPDDCEQREHGRQCPIQDTLVAIGWGSDHHCRYLYSLFCCESTGRNRRLACCSAPLAKAPRLPRARDGRGPARQTQRRPHPVRFSIDIGSSADAHCRPQRPGASPRLRDRDPSRMRDPGLDERRQVRR